MSETLAEYVVPVLITVGVVVVGVIVLPMLARYFGIAVRETKRSVEDAEQAYKEETRGK